MSQELNLQTTGCKSDNMSSNLPQITRSTGWQCSNNVLLSLKTNIHSEQTTSAVQYQQLKHLFVYKVMRKLFVRSGNLPESEKRIRDNLKDVEIQGFYLYTYSVDGNSLPIAGIKK